MPLVRADRDHDAPHARAMDAFKAKKAEFDAWLKNQSTPVRERRRDATREARGRDRARLTRDGGASDRTTRAW